MRKLLRNPVLAMRIVLRTLESTETSMKAIGLCKVAMLLGVVAVVPTALANDSDDSDISGGRRSAEGAVFTLGNSKAGNEVLAFHRGADGRLRRAGAFPTGGRG